MPDGSRSQVVTTEVRTGQGGRRAEPAAEAAREQTFSGPWWRFPPILGAALSGVLLALTFGLDRAGLMEQQVAIGLYLLSMPFAGYWWFREGLEELIHCREIGIEFLMASATAGAAAGPERSCNGPSGFDSVLTSRIAGVPDQSL